MASLLSPTPAPSPTPLAATLSSITLPPAGTDNDPWWNDTVFYEVFVRSFYDSNGDGTGDLQGLIAKLDYLRDLGVTGLWLMPIQPSPTYHGYDITDYYAVNPDYGTLADMKQLVNAAHQRGIRVIIDLVLNHTSDQNPWFTAALDPQSPYHNWYVWSERGGPNWHKASNGLYYYGYFSDRMPDLNYTEPAVTAEMQKVVSFWLGNLGVDGFRLDAVKYLVENQAALENSPGTHAWLKDFRAFYKSLTPQALTVGEIWDKTALAASYAQGDELDLAFDFDLAGLMVSEARVARGDIFSKKLQAELALFPPGQVATFLTNHDQPRVASNLNDSLPQLKLAAATLLTSPGVPFIYYGEEIGMLGQKPDEDIRVPMQWSAEKNGGFSTAAPWRALNPDYLTKNVAAESANPASLLNFYRALIHLRNDHAALRVGAPFFVQADQPGIFSLLRVSQAEAVLTVINLSAKPIDAYTLSLAASPLKGRYEPVALLDAEPLAELSVNVSGGFENYHPLKTLLPQSVFVIQLQSIP